MITASPVHVGMHDWKRGSVVKRISDIKQLIVGAITVVRSSLLKYVWHQFTQLE